MAARDLEHLREQGARLRQQGRLVEAAETLRRALEHAPGDARTWSELAHALRWLEKLDEAHEAAATAVRLAPKLADAWFNLGAVLVEEGKTEEGIAAYRKALELNPELAEAWSNLGGALGAEGKVTDEIESYRRALNVNPQLAPVWSNLGNVLRETGELDEAVSACRRAVELDPGLAVAWNNLGSALRDRGDIEHAIRAYETGLGLAPRFAEAWSNLGDTLQSAGRIDEAIRAHQSALESDPASAQLHFNFGVMLKRCGHADEAVARYRRALEIKPDLVEALVNLGIMRAEQGAYDEALELYRKALKLAPAHADAHYNYAFLCLALGDFEEGWANYQWRPVHVHVPESARHLDTALPDDVRDKTVLLLGEQGIGDELFFLRFAPGLKQRGAHLLCQCDRKLKSLLERTALFDIVVAHDESAPSADARLLVGDLPFNLLRIGYPALAPPLRLSVLAEKAAAIRERVGRLAPPPYMGLTWRAGTPHEAQRRGEPVLYKEVPLELFARVLEGIPGTVLALQRQARAGELEALSKALGRDVLDLSELNEDLEHMVALLALIDEYIGVSNTNMHLMAGVGRTARVLVPHPPEYRWMARGEESPWFPGFRVYRQHQNGDWSSASARLSDDLRHSLSPPSPA